jgi:MFS transporter, MHS family, proline/betaine transporter
MRANFISVFFSTTCIGNLLAHYDKALFSLLAPVIAPLLFSTQDTLTALILIHALLAVSMIARPLGALFFGWISDQFGRSHALCYSLVGIAGMTLAMGSLPYFVQAGKSLSPVWMLIIRMGQSFFAAGESANAAIFLLEKTPPAARNWVSGLYDATSTAGWFLASLGLAGLEYGGCLNTAWPYLCGAGGIVAVFGVALRWKAYARNKLLTQSEALIEYTDQKMIAFSQLLRQHWQAFLALIAVSGFSYTTYIFAFVFLNSYIPLVTPFNLQTLTWMNPLFIGIDIMIAPCLAYLANYWGRQRQMFWAAILVIISAIPGFYLLQCVSSIGGLFLIRLGIVLLGVAFGATYHAWAQTLVPAMGRGRLISVAYAIGSQLIGAPAAAISLWLYKHTAWVSAPALYLVGTAALAAWAVYKTPSQFT